MTIHTEHPFLSPEGERDPLRRLRGRMPSAVTVWTAGTQTQQRAGWTVSSLIVAAGEPPEVLGLVDEDSELAALAQQSRSVVVNILGWQHRTLADAFAGVGPAPGGPFRLGSWTDSAWGPVLSDAVGWLGATLADGQPEHAGWGLLLRGVVEQVTLAVGSVAGAQAGGLAYLHGRYRRVDD